MERTHPIPRYRWGPAPGPATGHDGTARHWAHHGIAVTATGDVVTMEPTGRRVVVVSPEGRRRRSWVADVENGHGLLVVRESGDDVLWIADNGISQPAGADGRYRSRRRDRGQYGHAVKYTLDGEELLRLEVPPVDGYDEGNFAPTDVAVDEQDAGGSGDIWVADGYGRHLVHRYTKDGAYVATLSGLEGLGRFDQPHAVALDRRGGQARILVADRGNSRIQAFDLEGRFLGAFGTGLLGRPSGLAIADSLLFVADLEARVSVFDAADALVSFVADDAVVPPPPGWPNAVDDDGLPCRPALRVGELRSPHGIAVDRAGRVYLSEWCIGGRLIRLDPAGPANGGEAGED